MSEKLKTDVMELVNSGKNMTEISKIVGVSVARVSQIVTEKRVEWAAKRDIATQDHIEVEVATVRYLRQEALSAWERSKNSDEVTITTTKKPEVDKKLKRSRDKVNTIRKEQQRTGMVGDIACLHLAESCTDKLLKLLGAYPKEEKDTHVNITQINWGDLSNPIPSTEIIDVTPSSEIEARIEAELHPPETK